MQTPHVVTQRWQPLHRNCSSGSLKACGLWRSVLRQQLWLVTFRVKWGRKEEQKDLYKGTSKCQVFANSACTQLSSVDVWKKVIMIQVSHFNISTVVCGLAANCLLTVVQCPERTPASPWPRVSTFCRPRWTQQETASRAKTAVRGTCEANTWMDTLFSSDTVSRC